MENVLSWLWLAARFRYVNKKLLALLQIFGDAKSIYLSRSYSDIKGLDDKSRKALMDKDLSHAKAIFKEMARIKGKIIVYGSANYPKLLMDTPNPPCVLYLKGKVPELDDVLTIGVVGTRRASDYGRLVTQRICKPLCESGAVIITGMASGIDSIGAWAAVESGGICVGVIANGMDVVYPVENAELYKAVAEKGCIMSEYPPGTPPISRNFPVRNRIIAGLSRGVLITEAPLKSGALITARHALDSNRDVFAVPRNITEERYSGTNLLIQQGAKLVQSAEDILCEYPYAVKITPEDTADDDKTVLVRSADHDSAPNAAEGLERIGSLAGTDKQIAQMLVENDMQIDEIARNLGMSVGMINTKLVMLEVKGIVKKLPGGMYRVVI